MILAADLLSNNEPSMTIFVHVDVCECSTIYPRHEKSETTENKASANARPSRQARKMYVYIWTANSFGTTAALHVGRTDDEGCRKKIPKKKSSGYASCGVALTNV